MNPYILMTLIATVGTWSVTALGAAIVIFLKSPSNKILNMMLGFSAGVMIAASFWSLLQPAIELAGETSALPPAIFVTLSFMIGALFLWMTDKAVSIMRESISTLPKASNGADNRILMLILAITLHNIPEGLAVGVAFGALQNELPNGALSPDGLTGAITVAVGIGLQNFPEGAAVSLPLRREGYSRKKSFLLGQASGLVEPAAGVLGACLIVYIHSILPFALGFAAGAMILVAVHELIPECQKNKKEQPYAATTGILCGFAIMMLLDVILG